VNQAWLEDKRAVASCSKTRIRQSIDEGIEDQAGWSFFFSWGYYRPKNGHSDSRYERKHVEPLGCFEGVNRRKTHVLSGHVTVSIPIRSSARLLKRALMRYPSFALGHTLPDPTTSKVEVRPTSTSPPSHTSRCRQSIAIPFAPTAHHVYVLSPSIASLLCPSVASLLCLLFRNGIWTTGEF
jgi:hypothetical protein